MTESFGACVAGAHRRSHAPA